MSLLRRLVELSVQIDLQHSSPTGLMDRHERYDHVVGEA